MHDDSVTFLRPGSAHSRSGLLAALLLLAAAAATAGNPPAISGPSRLAPGERATFRVQLAGDPAADACDAALTLRVPPAFRILRTFPIATRVDRVSGLIEFSPIATLASGDQALYELELEAPRGAAAGTLCATLAYGNCPRPRERDLEAGPVCAPLTVVTTPTRTIPEARSGRALANLRIIPCGSRPTVTPGGSTFDPNEWLDAAAQTLGTNPATDLLAKTNDTDLFLAFRIQDAGISANDEVQLFIDVDNGTGPPAANDRAYLLTRGGMGSRYSGAAAWATLLGAYAAFEIAELAGEWVVEIQIPLGDLGGPTFPMQVMQLAAEIRDGGVTSPWPATFLRLDQATMSRSDVYHCPPGMCSFTTWAQAPDALDPATVLERERIYDDISGPNARYATLRFGGGQESHSTLFSSGGSSGTVTQVELLVRFYVNALVSNDSLDLEVWYNGSRIAVDNIPNGQLNTYLNTPGTYVFDVTSARAWTMADFDPSADLDVRVIPRRNGGWDNVDLMLDAVGFQVSSDGTCIQPSASTPGPDLFLTKDDGFASVLAGQYLTYQIQYGNSGGTTATDVQIVDRIPANTTYRRGGAGVLCPPSATCLLEYSATGVAWTTVEPADGASPLWLRLSVSMLPPSGPASWAFAYQVRVDPFAVTGDRVENEATISLFQADANASDNSDWDDYSTAGDNLGDEVGPFVFPSITVPCDFTAPVIDGVIDPAAEYPNATVLTSFRTGTNETVTIRIQHDDLYLYVAFDVDDDEANNRDACHVTIDTNDNKLDPDVVDRLYERDRGNIDQFFNGIGSNSDGNIWSPMSDPAVLTAAAERAMGWQAELRIPFASLPGISGQGEIIGIAFLNFSTSCGSCWANNPAFAQLDNASSWTNAFLKPCAPNAEFECLPGCAGAPIACTDRSTNNPATFAWDFGDGSPVDTSQNPSHLYASGGSYNVTLTACNANGCSSKTMPLEVYGLPVPILSLPASSCIAPAALVNIDGSASQPGAGATITSPGGYVFTSTRGTLSGSTTALETLSATLADAGTATVTLTVTDSHGCSATISKDVVLAAPPLPVASVSPAAQCADPPAPLQFVLDATATTFPSGASPTLWDWTPPAGHGISGSGPMVILDVPALTPAGFYTTSLRVVDSFACEATTTIDTRLWLLPQVSLAAAPLRRCADPGAAIVVAATASVIPGDAPVPATGFSWSTSGPGLFSGGNSASETLTLPAGFTGTTDLCVKALDDNNCSASVCEIVTIDPLPVPDFTAPLPGDCADLANPIVIPLDASPTTPLASIPDPTGFAWTTSLGPGVLSASDGVAPTLTLPAGWSGTVTVTLTVTDVNGCSEVVARNLTVHPGPAPDFGPAPFETCSTPGAPVVIDLDATGSSSPAGLDPTGFVWSTSAGPGVLSSTTGPQPRLTLPPGFTGIVTVTLTLTDRDNCQRTLAHDYGFPPLPVAELLPDRDDVCRDPATPFRLDSSASSSAAGIPNPLGWSWSVSAGTLSATSGPVVDLTPAAGWFGPIDVAVTVTDARGCVGSASRTLVVHAGPTVAATATPLRQCAVASAATSFLLDASASAAAEGIAEIVWSTSEPQASLAVLGLGRATLTLPAGWVGTVPLSVRVTDNAGCSASEPLEVNVEALPTAVIAAPGAACDGSGLGASVALDARSSLLPGGPAPASPYVWSASAGSITPDPLDPARATLTAPVGFLGDLTVTLTVTSAAGCDDTTTRVVKIASGPSAALTAASTGLCSRSVDTDIDLDATGSSLSDPAAFAWSVAPATIGLASSSGATNRVTVPAGFAGTITVTVTVTDPLGCTASRSELITVHPPPVPVIAAGGATCAAPGEILIALDSAGSTPDPGIPDPSGWAWSASAGTLTPDHGRSATLTLPATFAGGTVNVTLTLTDGNGCVASETVALVVTRAPVAALSAAVTRACAAPGGTVFPLDASGSSGSNPLAYAWTSSVPGTTFAPAGSATPQVRLPAAFSGIASITVEVSDSAGCRDSRMVDLVVDPLPSPALATQVSGNCSPSGPELALDASGSSATAPATLGSFQFRVPGATAIVPTGAATARASFPPGTSGTFVAEVDVTDSAGCVATATSPFTLIAGRGGPVARLSAASSDLCLAPGTGQDVVLDASASDPGSFAWWSSPGTTIVGSGASVILRVPAGASGLLQARVTVTDSRGCGSDAAVEILAREMPRAVAAVSPAEACEGPTGTTFLVSGTASESRHPLDPTLTFTWTSPDGVLGDPNAASTTLDAPALGLGRVVAATLVVSDAGGCPSAPERTTAQVNPPTRAAFTATPAAPGLATSFDSAPTTGGTPPLAWNWAFGDGGSSSAARPSHVYGAPGTYTVTLEVSDAKGCRSAASQTVVIGGTLSGTLSADEVCAGAATSLLATVSGGAAPYRFDWRFGDGAVASGTRPDITHVYAAAGSYRAEVVVADSAGLTATLAATVVARPAPVVSVSTSGPALVGVAQTFAASASAGASVIWRFSDGFVATGASVSRTFATSGSITATASASSAAGCTAEASLSLVIATGEVAVGFAKSVSPAQTSPGGEVEYELWIGNGAGLVRDVEIEDYLPSGFEYRPGSLRIDGAAAGEPRSYVPLRFGIAEILPQQSLRVRYRARVAAGVLEGSYDNSASLHATDAAGGPVFVGPRVATVSIVAAPVVEEPKVDLRVIKRADPDPEPPAPGGLVHYRIEYLNAGDSTATDVVLQDDWPFDRSTLVDNGDGGSVLGSRIEWRIGTLPPGAAGTVQYTIRLNPDLANGTPVHNLVVVASAEQDERPQDNRDQVDLAIGGLPDLGLAKSVVTDPDPAGAGALATYTLAWRNSGASASGVVVTDDYDESQVAIETLPGGAVDQGGVLRIELGNVAAGASGTISYTARLLEGASGAVENRAVIAALLSDGNPADNTAQARFDVVSAPATLTLSGEMSPTRRCQRPQVEVALRGVGFDSAGAMRAAAEFLRAGRILRSSAAASDPLLASIFAELDGRLETFARLNVESLLFDSGMGLPWTSSERAPRTAEAARQAGLEAVPDFPAPVVIPFADAHPLFVLQRGLDEPWCTHELHRTTTPRAIGETLAALAAWAERSLTAAESDSRFRGRALLAQASEAVATLGGWRRAGVGGAVPGPLPGRVTLAADEHGELEPAVAESRASAHDLAALAKGLFSLAQVARANEAATPAGLAASAAGLGEQILTDLVGLLDAGGAPESSGAPLDIRAVAAAAEAIDAARTAGVLVPASLVATLERRLAELGAADGSGFALSVEPGSRGPVTLEAETAGLVAATVLGKSDVARATWRRLETGVTDTRLHIYRTAGEGGAISYTPDLLASVVGALARLVPGASPVERAELVERLGATIEKIAVEAGLQTGLVGRARDEADLRLILGADGEVKVSSLVADSPHALAPVLVDRVSFIAQGLHHQDRSRVDAGRGVRETGSAVAYLAAATGDCGSAEVRLLERRFVTESGLRASAAMVEAARALDRHGRAADDPLLVQTGRELASTAEGNRTNLTMLSGMGVRLAHAAGVSGPAAERELLERYARTAGLEAAPAALLPIWLPLAAGDPVFPEPLDARAAYPQGWEPSRFEGGLGAAALGQALLADVELAASGIARGPGWARFLGLVRLHAAGLEVGLIAREVAAGGFPGLLPVLDAAGRPVEIRRVDGAPTLLGDASLLEALAAYRGLVAKGGLEAISAGERPPLAGAEAERASRVLRERLGKALAAGRETDALGLAQAVRALLRWAELEPEDAEAALALARGASATLAAAAPGRDLSPLAQAALALEAEARSGGDGEAVSLRYRDLRDRFLDRTWRLFRSGVEAEPDREGAGSRAFVLTDTDVGSVLGGLAAALPALGRSEREEAADLIHAAAGRMLFETGLQREHRVEAVERGARVPGRALAISRSVKVTVADSPAPSGRVFPGDLMAATYTVENPTASSVAAETVVHVEAGKSLRYVPGSARRDGQPAPDPQEGETLRFALGRLGGSQTAELSFLLRVAADATPGPHKAGVRATGMSMPGAGGQPLETAPVLSTVPVEGFGGIAGRVYIDADGDGRVGPGDPAVPDVTVQLDDGTATVTDSEGNYRFTHLVPSAYRVRMLEGTLPGPMSTVGTGEARVQVRPLERAGADFGARSADVVTGIVYRDLNGNRRMDQDEPPVARVVVETGTGQRSISDASGRYLIRGVATGSHVVRPARRQPWVEDPSGLLLRPMALPQATISSAAP